MTAMQKDLYRGRTLACNNCAKTFSADELTPVPMETPRAWSPAAAVATQAAPAAAPAASGRPSRRPAGWGTTVSITAAALLVVGMLLALLVPPLNRAREQSRRVACATNMRQLGQAMMIYASVNAGHFPDRLDRLLVYVGSNTFVCPSTGHTPAAGQIPQTQAGNLAAGGHLSYVYVGDGYSTGSLMNAATMVVLYEPPGDHGDGVNVLYADGHVTFLSTGAALTAIPGLPSATPNPAGRTTAPATQAAGPGQTQ
jgi:prepilin-type processing-associated H-X9-DG protein